MNLKKHKEGYKGALKGAYKGGKLFNYIIIANKEKRE